MRNKKPICLIDATIALDEQHINQISEYFDIAIFHNDKLDLRLMQKAEAFLLHSRLSSENLSELINCKYVGIRAHNLDYIDIEAARKMKIEVCGIPPVGQRSVAEHTFALIFALAKHLFFSHQNVQSGKWRKLIPPSIELYKKYLGVIGYGAIGKKVAEIGRCMGMNVVVYDSKEGEGHVPLDDLLSLADVVTIHIPYRPPNHNFIDHQRISMMKNGALLINTARGGLLDYNALETALRSEKISGAGIDVFENEPPTVPNSLFDLPNVILTPHIAYYSREALFQMNSHLVENLIRYFRKI